MAHRRPPRLRREERRLLAQAFWRRVLIGGTIVGVIGIGFLIGLPGPRWDEAEVRRLEHADASERAALRTRIDALLTRLEEPAQSLTTAELEALKAAELDLQSLIVTAARTREVLSDEATEALPADAQQLERLQRLRDAALGAELARQVDAQQARADNALAAGQPEAALEALLAAQQALKSLGDQFPTHPGADERRRIALARQIDNLRLAPTRARIAALAEEADRALAIDDFPAAIVALQGALSYQQALVRDARDQRNVEKQRELELATRLDDLRARELIAEIARLRAEGAAALDADRSEQAEEAYRQALATQRQLRAQYPASQAATDAAAQELETEAARARVLPAVNMLVAELEQVRAQLREGQGEAAASRLPGLYRQLEQVRALPDADAFLSAALAEEVATLYRLREDLPALHQWLRARVVPLPTHPGLRLLNQEVGQTLYQRLMDNNPSARRDLRLPVESVTYDGAQECARRIGWVLGQAGRLPTQAEFVAAVGQIGSDEVMRTAWNSARREIDPQKPTVQPAAALSPNAIGAYDLLGNLSEWVTVDGAPDGQQGVAGGTLRDNPIRLRSIPVDLRLPTERDAFTGFRVVITPLESETSAP